MNKILEDLKSPNIQDTAARYAKIPLNAGLIRHIPFKLGEKKAIFCMRRLTLEGPWSVAFQNKAFDPFCSAYKRAVEQCSGTGVRRKGG